MELGRHFYPNAPKSGIRVRRSPGINGTIVESGSWLYGKTDWVEFDQVIKKDGYWWLRFKYQAPGSSKKISTALFVKLQINNKNKNEKYWGKIDWK